MFLLYIRFVLEGYIIHSPGNEAAEMKKTDGEAPQKNEESDKKHMVPFNLSEIFLSFYNTHI